MQSLDPASASPTAIPSAVPPTGVRREPEAFIAAMPADRTWSIQAPAASTPLKSPRNNPASASVRSGGELTAPKPHP